MEDKKLEVRNLTISFRTSNGRLQAVRGIDFDLYNGETLAIVGESGSGKSVTSKAILGILAGNSIIEGGEIIYDGKDLLKLSESEFHKIRGDKIAMIFQDPMSSLNPIVKIGRQLTEAMILKGKARQKESRFLFNSYLERLRVNMIEANKNISAAEITEKCKNFDKFEYRHLALESEYRRGYSAAAEAADEIDVLVFEMSKKGAKDVPYRVSKILNECKLSVHEYVVKEDKDELLSLAKQAKAALSADKKAGDESYATTSSLLAKIGEILRKALAKTMPNFFAMGYYLTFSGQQLPDMPVDELNVFLRKYLDDNFMLDFIANAKVGIMHSAAAADAKKREAIDILKAEKPLFTVENANKKAWLESAEKMKKAVEAGIDHLERVKDGVAYTFGDSLIASIENYFLAVEKNGKESARYEKEKAKYDAVVASGKTPKSEVIPASITDLNEAVNDILRKIDRVLDHYNERLAEASSRNFDDETVAMIDFLKENASGVVNKVTKSIAKAKAIKLMEEVGISEPRRRYNQYPFEFSGGMRQRIVIAIALAANPDVLICDEPTTALDVTIQSQILELINKLKRERHLSIIFITHDLGVVANMADRIAVMYAGKIVEYGTSSDIFYHSAHPYTWALLSSMPDLDTNEKLDSIPGTPPMMIYPPKGDAFAERNKYAMKIDFEMQPPMFKISDTHYAATWLLHPDAPHIDPPKTITDRIERMKQRRLTGNGNQ